MTSVAVLVSVGAVRQTVDAAPLVVDQVLHAIDEWGRSLVTDGAGGEGINLGFPGAAYVTAVGTPRILHGMNPGSPKLCGLAILSGALSGGVVAGNITRSRTCQGSNLFNGVSSTIAGNGAGTRTAPQHTW